MYFFITLGRHVNYGERMDPIDFGGQRSKVKVTIDIYGTRCGGDIVTLLWFRVCVCLSVRPFVDLVNTIKTTPLHVSLSNLADMLTMMRE